MIEILKNMKDEEIVNYIETIINDNVDLKTSELKSILAEASGRKLEKKYINIIAEKIRAKMQPEPVEEKRKKETPKAEEPAPKSKPTFDDVYNVEDEEEDAEEEKYPVLSFLVGLYKVFAVILLIGVITIAGVVSLLLFKEHIPIVCAIMFGSIILGVFLFIAFFSMSEKIKLQLDIEKHLRNLLNN